MITDIYRTNPTNVLWEKDLGTTFKFEVSGLDKHFETFEICPYLRSNLATHYELGPERDAFFGANIGLEFEGFCDYSKGIYDATLEFLYYTNEDGDVMLWNDTTVYADAPWNVEEPQFNQLKDSDLLQTTLDGKGQFRIGYTPYYFNMPLGTYRV